MFAEEIGNVCNGCYVHNGRIQNHCIDMAKFSKTSSMKAATHLGPNFKSNSEIYKNTQFEDIESVFNITQKLVREHSEEILNVKCLEYSSPSWARSGSANDQALDWAKAKVCVYADSVFCVGQMKDTPDAIERWKGQVEGLRLYSSYQDAVGIDEGAIDFECTNFQGFSSLSILEKSKKTWRHGESSQRSSQTGSSLCQCSMTLYGTRMMRIVLRMPKKSRITQRGSFLAGHWTFLGPGSEEKWYGSSNHAQKGQWTCTADKNGTAIQKDWSSCVQRCQCLESWSPKAEEW